MKGYILRRLLWMVVVLFGVAVVTFPVWPLVLTNIWLTGGK